MAARYGTVQRQTASSSSSWSPSQDAQSDAHDLLFDREPPATVSSSAEDWCEKIANRLQLAFDALEEGVDSARQVLQEPADRTPPDDSAMELALTLAMIGVGGPASAIVGRFITQAVTNGVFAEAIKTGVRTAISRSLQKGVEAVTSLSKARGPAEEGEVAESYMLNRFCTSQRLTLAKAKGDAFDYFIDAVRPALLNAPESYLRSLHEHLSILSASEELAYAQAARTIAAWTTYLAYWTHGSFGSLVDFYKGLGSGYWRQRYAEGTVQIRLRPIEVPELIFVRPFDVIGGTAVEVMDMQISGISDSAKAVLRDNMQFIGDLRSVPMFVSFQAHMLPSQETIVTGIGPLRKEHRTFRIELARQPDGSVMLSKFHPEHEDEWLSAYYGAIYGSGSAQQGARDIFDQLDGVPLPDFR